MSKPHDSVFSAIILALVLSSVPTVLLSAGRPDALPIDPALLKALSWRSIGPAHFSSRAADIAGVPGDPFTFYLAFGSAGLFKTTNGGTTFTSIFNDGGTLSIGAIALSPADPDVVYVGTGEGNLRNCVSFGDGLYKTTDGGKTWTNLGLRDSERFTRIVVDPKDPNIVFAAAMGHLWGPNRERGLYRSTDAGATWKQVLYVNEQTGASDVAVDPKDPDIVYCGMYEILRQPWHVQSGGPGSGLYRSADGGVTWTKLTDPALHNGLPGAKLIGRIGLTIAASNPNVVYALMECEEPGSLWRSDDRGIHWTLVTENKGINNRPFYYTTIYCDPTDEDHVFSLCTGFLVSRDGGRTWSYGGGNTFGDFHVVWIDPLNPKRVLNGNDGGFYLSNDGGTNWEPLNNMASAPAYHVGVDTAEPYHVMAGFQDHEIWRGPSEKWNEVGVQGGDWVRLRDMADGMYALADPRDPHILYYNGHFGDITTIDMRDQEEHFIQPYPVGPTGTGAHMDKYRFNWNSPVHISPSDPDVVYYGGNVVFKTTDRGRSWKVISPDLTTDDKSKQQTQRRDHSRQHQGRMVLHDPRARRKPARPEGPLGVHGRRKRPVDARRREVLDECVRPHPGSAATGLCRNDHGLPARARGGLHRRRSAPLERLRSPCFRHLRFRPDMAADRRRAERVRPYRQGRTPHAGIALGRNRARRFCFVRRRRELDRSPAGDSSRACSRPRVPGQGQRPRHRDPCPGLLYSRRHHAAPEARGVGPGRGEGRPFYARSADPVYAGQRYERSRRPAFPGAEQAVRGDHFLLPRIPRTRGHGSSGDLSMPPEPRCATSKGPERPGSTASFGTFATTFGPF